MSVDPQVAKALQVLGQDQIKVLTGTVTSTTANAQQTPVQLDGDSALNEQPSLLLIPSLCGIIPGGTRVTIFTVPPAGMVIVGIVGAPYNLIDLWNYYVNTVVPIVNNPVWVIRRLYVANDTWNKPTSSLFLGVNVKIQSGGGGSGGTAAAAVSETSGSAGGQGGGYVEGYTLASFLSATGTVVIGAGGTAAAAGNNAGGTGGTTSFTSGASVLSITGGVGGSGGGSAGAGQTTQAGGTGAQTVTATNFDVVDVRQGDDGGQGFRIGSGDTGVIWPGYGGGSRMGAQTRIGTLVTAGSITNKQIPPIAGWAYGGGASGRGVNAYAGGGGVAASGGAAGGQGLMVIEEWYRT